MTRSQTTSVIRVTGSHCALIAMAALVTVIMLTVLPGEKAWASYGNIPQNTHIDPELVRIDEKTYLGTKLTSDYVMQDADGNEFRLGELMGKPLILMLSYYNCDGVCPVLNKNLTATLAEVKRWRLGEDFNVLTVSFDRHDTPESLRMFMDHTGFASGMPAGRRMALLKNPEDIQKLTQSIGFKYFWSARDAMFLHPNVYTVLSPEGRVTRYLYGASISGQDMELSITKAYGNEITPANLINFVLGTCYSYNYEDGKYAVNYPLFIAFGSMMFGVSMIIGGSMIMKKKKRRCAT